ncbi:caspase family protein [candidate division KSB1 bacterium]|nr:caspase family protein [candidate division KSB1 bacterium]
MKKPKLYCHFERAKRREKSGRFTYSQIPPEACPERSRRGRNDKIVYIFVFFLFASNFLSQFSILYPQSSINFGDRYAVIIGGIGGQKEFTEEYFDQTNRMYDLLVNELDYKSENVFYLFEDLAYDSLKIKAKCTAENVRDVMNRLAVKMKQEDQLFIFMVGHGTFDGTWSKFNLLGPDLKAIDYAQLLAKLPTNKIILVNTSSASGPFIKKLSGKERVIITATKSGREYFETSFANFFLDAFDDNQADLNKDNRVSILEAFKFAKTSQDKWYEDQRRLRAEHPLLDDNGDGKGSQDFEDAEDGKWASRVYLAGLSSEFQTSLQRLKSGTQSPADSLRLEKLGLGQAIEDLKAKKDQLSLQEYTSQLESLLVQLAKTNQRLKKVKGGKKE